MGLKQIKWYSVLLYFLASVLSLADTTTDILMAIEFFCTDHKTWFAVVVTFIILPCVLLPLVQLFCFSDTLGFESSCLCSCLRSCHPFSTACANFRVCTLCWKKFRKFCCSEHEGTDGNHNEDVGNEGLEGIKVFAMSEDLKDTAIANCEADENKVVEDKASSTNMKTGVMESVKNSPGINQGSGFRRTQDERLFKFSKIASYVEASTESAPQFIIQLYAINVQQEPVGIIQMVSLATSFLSFTWVYTSSEGVFSGEAVNFDLLNFKMKASYFVLNLVSLSSRLLAITYFTVSYKWWVICPLGLHASIMTVAFIHWVITSHLKCCNTIRDTFFGLVTFGSLYWLKACLCVIGKSNRQNRGNGMSNLLNLSNVLFLIENLIMILVFYFSSNFPHTWYTLPVTLYVCISSAASFLIKVAIAICSQHQNNRIGR